jgi:hypothetical protein
MSVCQAESLSSSTTMSLSVSCAAGRSATTKWRTYHMHRRAPSKSFDYGVVCSGSAPVGDDFTWFRDTSYSDHNGVIDSCLLVSRPLQPFPVS